MLVVGQLPGVDQAVDAASKSSWEAVVLVIVMIAGLSSFAWVIKQIMNRHMATEERILKEAGERETRLANRVSTLEDMVRTELLNLIKQNSEAMGRMLAAASAIVEAANRMTSTLDRFSVALDVRPCLLSPAKLRSLIENLEGQQNKDT